MIWVSVRHLSDCLIADRCEPFKSADVSAALSGYGQFPLWWRSMPHCDICNRQQLVCVLLIFLEKPNLTPNICCMTDMFVQVFPKDQLFEHCLTGAAVPCTATLHYIQWHSASTRSIIHHNSYHASRLDLSHGRSGSTSSMVCFTSECIP